MQRLGGIREKMPPHLMCFTCLVSEFHSENALAVAGSGISCLTSVDI